jgi:hypothetical protein
MCLTNNTTTRWQSERERVSMCLIITNNTATRWQSEGERRDSVRRKTDSTVRLRNTLGHNQKKGGETCLSF